MKYRRWAEELRQQILSGELAPGDRLPSQTVMRDRYGVSRPLVERIHSLLEEDGLIVREPGKGVFVAVSEHRKTRKAQVTSQGMIGCLSFAMTNKRLEPEHRVYWSHLLGGIEQEVRSAQRQVLLFDQFSPGDAWEKIDGVITTEESIPGALGNVPAVCLLKRSQEISSVLVDNGGGTREAVRHLLDLGHRRIGCLMFTDDPFSCEKIRGYRAEMRAAGIDPPPKWLRSLTDPGQNQFNYLRYGELRMSQWLSDDWSTLGLTAVICENDQAAIGVITALRGHGLGVPHDVSVVGFDGTEVSEYSHPALTTVDVPLEDIGRRAVSEVLRQIKEYDTAVREIVLPTKLHIRQSTAPPRS